MKTKNCLLKALVIVSLMSHAANAETAPRSTKWSTATHLGYGVVDRSSTGFKDVAGSMMFLDVTRKVGDDVSIGLRTIGQGGEASGAEFYRLAAGPAANMRLGTWNVHGSVGLFRESVNAADSTRIYKSMGRIVLFGLQRVRPIAGGAELAWGSFVSLHDGSVDMLTPDAAAISTHGSKSNFGISHGIECSLKLPL